MNNPVNPIQKFIKIFTNSRSNAPVANDLDGPQFMRGAVSGLFFGLLATIPWIFLSTFTGFFVGFLGYIIGLATYNGFVLGAGVQHKSSLYVVLPVILFAIPFSEAISIFLSVLMDMGDLGLSLNLENVRFVFFDLLDYQAILSNSVLGILIGYFIAFLGSASLISKIRKLKGRPEHEQHLAEI